MEPNPRSMINRMRSLLLVLAVIGTTFWLSRNFKLVRIESKPAGQVQSANQPNRQMVGASAGQAEVDGIPESSRHAAGEMQQRRLAALDQAVRDQEDKVVERRKVLATIVRTKGIIYRGQDASDGQPAADDVQSARNTDQAYNELEAQKMQLESQINSLLKYDDQELMAYAAGLDLPDYGVKVLYPQYQEAKRELDLLKRRGLGDRHPALMSRAQQVEALELQMNESVVNMRATLQAQLVMATDRLKGVEETRRKAINRAIDAQDYVDAKRDFEADQQLLQEMKLKQISEKMEEAGR